MADPDTFRVSPSLRGLPRLEAPSPESAGPRQMIALGEATQRAGQIGGQLYEDVLREQNATRVEEALTEFAKITHERTYGENGWATLKGKNALERGDKSLDQEVTDDLNEQAENFSLRLGNDAQRKLFKSRANAAVSNIQGKVIEHLAREGVTYRQETLIGKGDTFSRLASESDPFSDDQNNALGAAREAYGKLYAMQGGPEAGKDDFLRKMMTPGHVAAVNRLVSMEALESAEQYFQQHRDDLTLDAATQIEGVLVEQRTITNAYNIGEQAVGMAIEQNEAAAPQAITAPVAFDQFGISSNYGVRRGDRAHGGVDIPTPVGTTIRAGGDGVARVRRGKKYGLYVDVELADGTVQRFAHLEDTSIKDGDRVTAGQVVAKSGGARGAPNAGNSTGPHLHYEVIGADGARRDPIAWHQGQPKVTPGAARGSTWSEVVESIVSQDLPPKMERYALDRARTIWAARDESRREAEEDLISSAYAEIDGKGSLSNATRSKIIAAGLGSTIPSLRSFEEATQNRAAGGTVDETTSLLAYGTIREQIALGKITSVDQILQYKPFLDESMAKQLIDDLANPQTARVRADKIIGTMNDEIRGSGLFFNEDGKQDNETRKEYQRFVGAVTRQIEAEEANTGKLVPETRQREIILGMLAQQTISATGSEMPGYQVRNTYDNIPRDVRLRIVRSLQSSGVRTPSQAQVVSAWRRMQ